MKGASLIIANLDFHGEGVRRAPQAGPNMVYALGIHPRFANQLYNITWKLSPSVLGMEALLLWVKRASVQSG